MIPPTPHGAPRATAQLPLRFEDVSQDGRLLLEALPSALGPTVWGGLLRDDPASTALFARGIVPILSRFVLESHPGPISASALLDAEGAYQLSRTREPGPAPPRLMLDMWAELHGPIGRTYGKTDRDGERVLVGRVYAEHVLSRPFAAAGERRVTSLDFPGAPSVTATRAPPPTAELVATLPHGAEPLEDALRLDAAALVLGLVHTDSNQHVNSLAYLRLFEEAALRRFASLGRSAVVLARSIDIAYRKPCFAGQTVRVVQQAFELDGELGVVAALVDRADAASAEELERARPHACARLLFAR